MDSVKHIIFDDTNIQIIPVDNWKEYNHYETFYEADDCGCNCNLI